MKREGGLRETKRRDWLHETYGYLYMYETLIHIFGEYPKCPLGIVEAK